MGGGGGGEVSGAGDIAECLCGWVRCSKTGNGIRLSHVSSIAVAVVVWLLFVSTRRLHLWEKMLCRD